MFRHHHAALVLVIGLISGCEGARNNSSWSTAKEGDPILPLLTTDTHKEDALTPLTGTATPGPAATTTTSGGNLGRGVGPVDKVDIASLDGARALKGAELFKLKCSACHKLDERYIGPALAGVTKRRQPEWILNMILNPENMIQQDPTAKALLAEFLAPMANQHLTREEAESILAYFLQHDGALPAAEGERQSAATGSGVQATQK